MHWVMLSVFVGIGFMANAGLNQCMVREQLLLLTSPVYWTEGSSLLKSTAAFRSVFIIFCVCMLPTSFSFHIVCLCFTGHLGEEGKFV